MPLTWLSIFEEKGVLLILFVGVNIFPCNTFLLSQNSADSDIDDYSNYAMNFITFDKLLLI